MHTVFTLHQIYTPCPKISDPLEMLIPDRFVTKFETVIEAIILNLHLKFEFKVATFGLDASS